MLLEITAQAVNSWFTPFHYIVYLSAILIIMIIFGLVKWTNDCETKILLKILKSDGMVDTKLVPKEGASVTLTNPKTNVSRTWPINKTTAAYVSYPGLAFIPKILQKHIAEIWVDEDDWEPILNRNAYIDGVASPDVKVWLLATAELETDKDKKQRLIDYANSLKQAPTRKMIASPEILGNILAEKVTELVVRMQQEMLESVAAITAKLKNMVNPMIVYIGLGLILILTCFNIYTAMQGPSNTTEIQQDIKLIKQSLGIKDLPKP